nr:anti-sigma-D factor RsdA [Amycolatopsis nigrescens]
MFEEAATNGESPLPADLSAVQADDALLDALGGSDPKVADGLGDQELNALLLAWRRDIDSEPLAELVDTDTAVTTVKTAALAHRHGQRGRRRRMLVPVAAAAAVLAIAFTGTGLAARDAQPGDTLWGLSKVLYADHARSVEAAAAARSDLNEANIALAQGRYADARKALDAAQSALREVASEDDLAQLMAQHQQLLAMLQYPAPPQSQLPPNNSQTPPPSSPQVTQPQVPAPNPTDTAPTVIPPVTSDSVPPETTTPPSSTTTSTPAGTGSEPGGSGPRDDSSNAPPPGGNQPQAPGT